MFRRILFSLFPKPRRPVTLLRAVPLIAFLIVYAAASIWLHWSDWIIFAQPWRFALMAICVWVWWLSVAGWSGLAGTRAIVALLTRLSLIGVFVMLLAEPRAVRTSDELAVVYGLDISDSIGEGSVDAALEFLTRTVAEKPASDEAGLVVFGRNASVELPPQPSFPYEEDSVALNSRIDRDATNLEQALSLSAAMLPEENPGRIVLISDGTHTEGSMSRVLDELKSRDIAVDVLPIQYDYDREVWVERLELPPHVKIGENYEAAIVLSSLQEGSGRLVLRENGDIVFEGIVQFKPGKNRFVLPIKLRAPGYYEYSATIDLPDEGDHLRENNTALDYIFVAGEGKVLVVTDPQGDDRDWQPLVDAMREAERVVDVVMSYDFPRDALSLMPYDAIVMVNAPADVFDVVQLQAIHDAVKDLGLGLLMVGGANSYGPGGYHRTVIEEALPVTMDVTKKKILPKGALVIVLHTCEFPEGNTWAKRISKQAIKVLGDQDEVGLLAYTGTGENWIFTLTPASEYTKLVPKINAASIGDMPSFVPTMQMALTALRASDSAARHMIIISDGDPSPPPPTLLQSFVDNQISVTTVSIFPHGGVEVQTMRLIAEATGGRYYNPSDANQLPSIFIKESKTLKRSMIQNETFTPEVMHLSEVLKGIDSLPPLHGYVLTTPKNRAELVLKAPVKEQDQIDPILALGRHGLGATAAFTSDLSSNWGADWIGWEHYQPFIKQLMIRISRVRKDGHLRLWSYTSGNEGTLVVEDYAPETSFLDIQAQVSGPRDQSTNVRLKQTGPRRYQATVPLWGRGRYQVIAAPVEGDRKDERAVGGFVVPYSPEYLRFRSNPIILNEIAEKTGGRILSNDATADDIYRSQRKPKRSSRPVFDLFLLALACLVPLDVAARRIQIDLYVIKSWFTFGEARGPTTETMGALLQRKHAVGREMASRREEARQRPAGKKKHLARKPSVESPPEPEPQPMAEAEGMTSTTARLLEMKRKRRELDDNQSRQDRNQ